MFMENAVLLVSDNAADQEEKADRACGQNEQYGERNPT
jgi:hypothetical protein